MAARHLPRLETVVVGVLRLDRLPELVVVAPGGDDQEVEARPAAVEDDEAELAAEVELGLVERLPSEFADLPRTGALAGAISYHLSTAPAAVTASPGSTRLKTCS